MLASNSATVKAPKLHEYTDKQSFSLSNPSEIEAWHFLNAIYHRITLTGARLPN